MMDKPQKKYLYLVSEDDKRTAYFMWLVDTDDTHYAFKRSESRPCEAGTEWAKECVGGMFIPHEAWLDHSEALPFQVIRVIQGQTPGISLGVDEPTVYFVPEPDSK